MAQIMQWLHAIWNYMKRNISTIPPTHMHPSNKSLLSKGRSVTTRLGIYRDLFTHVHAVSGMHHTYIDQQAIDVWNRAKHH